MNFWILTPRTGVPHFFGGGGVARGGGGGGQNYLWPLCADLDRALGPPFSYTCNPNLWRGYQV